MGILHYSAVLIPLFMAELENGKGGKEKKRRRKMGFLFFLDEMLVILDSMMACLGLVVVVM